MDNLRFSINDDGVLTEYKIIKILTPKDSKYQYVVYTDHDDNIYSSRYDIVDGNIVLKPIEDDYEWQYINSHIKEEN